MTNITYEDGTLWFEDGTTMKAPAEIIAKLQLDDVLEFGCIEAFDVYDTDEEEEDD